MTSTLPGSWEFKSCLNSPLASSAPRLAHSKVVPGAFGPAWSQMSLSPPRLVCLCTLHAIGYPRIKQKLQKTSAEMGRGFHTQLFLSINSKWFFFLKTCDSGEAEEYEKHDQCIFFIMKQCIFIIENLKYKDKRRKKSFNICFSFCSSVFSVFNTEYVFFFLMSHLIYLLLLANLIFDCAQT